MLIQGLEKVKEYMASKGLSYEILYDEEPIRSASDAFKKYGKSQTAPILIVKTERRFYALLLSGDRGRMDLDRMKDILQCEKIKLAERKEVLELTGSEVGHVPLVGHGLPCVLDRRLLLQTIIYGGAGEPHYTLKMDPKDLEKANAIIATFE